MLYLIYFRMRFIPWIVLQEIVIESVRNCHRVSQGTYFEVYMGNINLHAP